jgi:hypothetical protein
VQGSCINITQNVTVGEGGFFQLNTYGKIWKNLEKSGKIWKNLEKSGKIWKIVTVLTVTVLHLGLNSSIKN